MKNTIFKTVGLTALLAISTACSAAPKMYSFESDTNGFNTKNYFYDNGEEVVVFDTQFTPEIAQQSIDYVRTQTSHPITHVVITHPNPDKFNGMSVFQSIGADVIASARTASSMKGVHEYKKYYFVNVAKMFTEASYPKLSTPDVTFDQSYELRLKNGEIITLRELAQPGVSSNQTVALIPSIQAMVVGDLVHHGVHAWLEGGIVNGKPTPTLKGWIADLKEMQSLVEDKPQTLIYAGRGDVTTIGDAVDSQTTYLNQADALVSQYVANLGNAKPDYQALQAQFETAFPGYGLGYMIGYGVYGLVDSKL